MKPKQRSMQRVLVWVAVACLRWLPLFLLSAQQPRLRTILKGHTNWAEAVAFSRDG